VKDKLRDKTNPIKRTLEQKPEILLAMIYGSYIDKKRKYVRDLDLAIFVDKCKVRDTLDYKLSLEEELEQIAEVPIDVRILNDAPPGFRNIALRGKVLVDRGVHDALLKMTIEELNALKIKKSYSRLKV